MQKKCSQCKETKPYNDFRKSKDTKIGLSSACKQCLNAAPRKHNDLCCLVCKKDFKRRSDNKKTAPCRECSRKLVGAKGKGRVLEKARKGKYIKCDNCGKEHYKRRSHLLRGSKTHFCSVGCQGAYSAKYYVPKELIINVDNSGSNNGRYKHGNRVGGYVRHKKLRGSIAKRDGTGCLLCKSNEKLHVHRIIPGALGGKYELDNTVILCNIHHAEVHRNYDEWKPKLERMAKDRTSL